MLTEVISTFSKGKFTQELDCVINQFPGITNKSDKNAAGRPSNVQENVFDTRQGIQENVFNPAQDIQESVFDPTSGGISGAGSSNTNKSLNSGSQANDNNVVNPTKQPLNVGGDGGGREVDLTQANAALAARVRDNAATNAQLRLLGRSAGGNPLGRPRGGA